MESLRLVSYNIHKCVGMDGRHDPERILRVLDETGGDLIALQEVPLGNGDRNNPDSDFLRLVCDRHVCTGPTIEREDGHWGNVLLSRWAPERSTLVDLSIKGREPRGAISAILAPFSTRMRVVVAHFGLHWRERRRQAQFLVDHVVERNGVDLDVLIGDFNEWFLDALSLRPINRAMGRSQRMRTFPAFWPVLCLDRIWIRPTQQMADLFVHRSPLARKASDHLPVIADLSLPTAQADPG